MTAKTERVTANLTPDERGQLKAHADREQRSEAWIVRAAVLAYLDGGKAK